MNLYALFTQYFSVLFLVSVLSFMSKSHCVNLVYVPQLNKVTLNSEKLLSNVFFLDGFPRYHTLCNEISDKSHVAAIYGALHMCRGLF